MIQKWYEIWVDESTEVPYVLFVCPDRNDFNRIIIIDPKEDKIIENMPNYEMAKDWLCEDEYTIVNGRMKVDDF
jgi:hypothetical protein